MQLEVGDTRPGKLSELENGDLPTINGDLPTINSDLTTINGDLMVIYPLVNILKAIENGHRNSEFSHETWWIFP